MILKRTRGLTLIEVVISSGVLATLVLAASSATLVLKGATVEKGTTVQMDSTARRILTEIRRDIRSSGFKQTGAATFQVVSDAGAPVPDGTPGGGIVFRKRLGPNDTDDDPNGWSESITYRRVADAPFTGIQAPVPNRFRLEQIVGTLNVPLAQDLSDLTFMRVIEDGTILVRLTLTRNNPNWSNGSTPPPAITRTYEDQVQMLNQAP